MIYGKKMKQRLFVAYTYENGAGQVVLYLKDYHGMSMKLLNDMQEYLSEKIGKTVVITNWKELH